MVVHRGRGKERGKGGGSELGKRGRGKGDTFRPGGGKSTEKMGRGQVR
jgi:hypothetical protein